MKIDAAINALNTISESFNRMPGRIMDSMHNPESKDSVEKVFTDMMSGENAYEANVKAIRHMAGLEQILLNDLREK